MDKIVWKTEKRKLSELKPCEWNPRKADKKQTEDLKRSLDKFSLADPLIINTDNTLIGGHFRTKVLKEQGDIEVDVRVPNRELTEEEVKELNIRLNLNQGEFDWDLLANFDTDFLQDVGFTDCEFNLDLDKDIKQGEFDENIETKNKCPKCGYEY